MLLRLQVKETDSYHVVLVSKVDEADDNILMLLPTVEAGAFRTEVQMRCLTYMGSYLLSYASAQVGCSFLLCMPLLFHG